MPRFVILQHEFRTSSDRTAHWDFMLEAGETLRTWALAEAPFESVRIMAQQLADHRLAYLDYEGAISGDRGAVSRWDEGTYHVERETVGELTISLAGRRWTGLVRFVQDAADPQRWSFTVEPAT